MPEELRPLLKNLPPRTARTLLQAVNRCGEELNIGADWVRRWIGLMVVADALTRYALGGEPTFELKGGAAIELSLRWLDKGNVGHPDRQEPLLIRSQGYLVRSPPFSRGHPQAARSYVGNGQIRPLWTFPRVASTLASIRPISASVISGGGAWQTATNIRTAPMARTSVRLRSWT